MLELWFPKHCIIPLLKMLSYSTENIFLNEKASMTASHLTISIKAGSNKVQISANWAYFDLQKHRIKTGLFPVKVQLLLQRKMAMKSPWEYFTTSYQS